MDGTCTNIRRAVLRELQLEYQQWQVELQCESCEWQRLESWQSRFLSRNYVYIKKAKGLAFRFLLGIFNPFFPASQHFADFRQCRSELGIFPITDDFAFPGNLQKEFQNIQNGNGFDDVR